MSLPFLLLHRLKLLSPVAQRLAWLIFEGFLSNSKEVSMP
jgi:hypothetical protein